MRTMLSNRSHRSIDAIDKIVYSSDYNQFVSSFSRRQQQLRRLQIDTTAIGNRVRAVHYKNETKAWRSVLDELPNVAGVD